MTRGTILAIIGFGLLLISGSFFCGYAAMQPEITWFTRVVFAGLALAFPVCWVKITQKITANPADSTP